MWTQQQQEQQQQRQQIHQIWQSYLTRSLSLTHFLFPLRLSHSICQLLGSPLSFVLTDNFGNRKFVYSMFVFRICIRFRIRIWKKACCDYHVAYFEAPAFSIWFELVLEINFENYATICYNWNINHLTFKRIVCTFLFLSV